MKAGGQAKRRQITCQVDCSRKLLAQLTSCFQPDTFVRSRNLVVDTETSQQNGLLFCIIFLTNAAAVDPLAIFERQMTDFLDLAKRWSSAPN